MLTPNFSSDLLTAGTNKPKPNQPENPIPHRGSGRRSFNTYLGNFSSAA
ncbi:MAG TPA: hypothetical protein VK184_18435 [Nostocaceae cyanobacterium]|nr:hypothetical protein [Nostocaceae cyanobacterium]